MDKTTVIPTLPALTGSSSVKQFIVLVSWAGRIHKLPVYAYTLRVARELAFRHGYTLISGSTDEENSE